MALDIVTLAAAKKYTRDSLIGMGALIGAPCTIKNIVHQDGINTVTFEWTGTDGNIREQDMIVYDGTPIYVWEAGNTYNYGDLVIYESQFYRCIVENSDGTFDETKWNGIGTADGNYDIVANSDLLPARFTAADRKMYYSIADGFFWLWNGVKWVDQQPKCSIQVNSLPVASVDELNNIYEYVGNSTSILTNGFFYKCEYDSATSTYKWINIKVQEDNGSDTQYDTIPTADSTREGDIVQYIGETNVDYTNGYFYKCINDSDVYRWVNITVQERGNSNIVEGYYNTADGLFYEESTYTTAITGATNTEYIDLLNNKTYRWNGTEFVRLDNETVNIATSNTVGTIKPDSITTSVDINGTIHSKVWAGTLARYYVVKNDIPDDTVIIITDYDGVPPNTCPDDYYVNGVKIVLWSTGTDQEIADMVAGADAGLITLTDYWKVGDRRTQHRSAIAANPSGAFVDGMPAQDDELVLMNVGYMNQTGINFVVGKCNGSNGFVRMNNTGTNVGSWKDSLIRAELNDAYYNSYSSTFKSILKPFTVATANGATGTDLQTTTDYIALFAEKEVFGNEPRYEQWRIHRSNPSESDALSIMEYFSQNNTLLWSTAQGKESTWLWWFRSPAYTYPTAFLVNHAGGQSAINSAANYGCGVIPFFCI